MYATEEQRSNTKNRPGPAGLRRTFPLAALRRLAVHKALILRDAPCQREYPQATRFAINGE